MLNTLKKWALVMRILISHLSENNSFRYSWAESSSLVLKLNVNRTRLIWWQELPMALLELIKRFFWLEVCIFRNDLSNFFFFFFFNASPTPDVETILIC